MDTRSACLVAQRKSQNFLSTSFFYLKKGSSIGATNEVVNPFQPSLAFHTETSHLFHCKTNDWFLYEVKHWAEMG